MSSYLVLTATGRDRPGVVEKVTAKIAEHHGNIETSRMSRLGGEFAMLVLLSLDESKVDSLLGAMRELDEIGLTTRVRKTTSTDKNVYSGHMPLDVRVSGADHAGIIRAVSRQLAQLEVNIESMDTSVTSAPWSGAPLFTMSAVVFAPPDISLEELEEVMEATSDELSVDIEVSQHRDI